MAGFKRVFSVNPGFNILGNIESVNTIDIPPPASPLGAGVGVVCAIGEFENGPLNTPIRIFGGADFGAKFGGFGFEYDGVTNQLPVAVRSAGADNDNYWAGNGFLAIRNKRFAGLICVRVDNSPGSVEFNRLACLTGDAPPYALANGDTFIVSVDGGGPVVVTFTGLKATLLGVGAGFPTGFVGGETLELSIDGGPTQFVQFQAADQTIAQVINRINSATASTIAFDVGGQIELRSLIEGYSATIEVIGGTAATALGFPALPVAQEDLITIVANSGGGDFTLQTSLLIGGVPTDIDATYTAGGADTPAQVRDGLLNAILALEIPGITYTAGPNPEDITVVGDLNVEFSLTVVAEPGAGDVSLTSVVPGVLTKGFGSGNVARLDRVSAGESATIIQAIPGVSVDLTPDGDLRVCNTATPATGSIMIDALSTAAPKMGFALAITAFATEGKETVIPAGTRVRDTVNNALWVTLEDTEIEEQIGGPYLAKVRPGVDNDTTPTAAAGTITEIVGALPSGFAVDNPTDLSRLNSTQMDVRYQEAIDSTIDVSGVPEEINIIYAARSSEQIGLKLRANAVDATATGHKARKEIFSPPLGTSLDGAQGSVDVGVGNVGREQRTFYVFPGFITYIPEIAAKGDLGGPGFTPDGVIQMMGNGFYASVASILPPEQNRGQQLSDTNYGPLNALGLEDAYNKELGGIGLTIDNYISFKASGIIAPRNDRSAGLVFQSDVTSVNPATQPQLVDAKRRFMGDFIIDSLSDIATSYVKKLNTPIRRRAFQSALNSFLEQLLSPNQPEASRIEAFNVVDDTTADQRAQGFQIYNVAVRIYPSMDYIIFRTTIGTTVDVSEIGSDLNQPGG